MDRRKIEEKIGYAFRDSALLERAFTHSSACPKPSGNYQNLEFLGDSVLEYVVSARLYALYPSADEGRLTKMRAAVVSERPLAVAVDRLGIADELITGENERMSGLTSHSSVKCDLFESLTAAVCLDGGLGEAEKFVLRCLADELASAGDDEKLTDAKSRLNEYAMKKGVSVRYCEEGRSGAPHEPEFVFSVYIAGECAGTGRGSSKREAQQHAAQQALRSLSKPQRKKKS